MSGPERAGAYIFIGDRQRSVTEWKHQLGTTDEQMEIFLLKYPDMDRDNLKYIIENLFESDEILSQPLNESEVRTIADDIGITLDEIEIAKFIKKLPPKQESKTFFTEIACFIFSKPFIRDLSDLKDEEAEAKTQAAATKVQVIQNTIGEKKAAEEKAKEDARKMEESIQEKLQKGSSSVAARAAMFEKSTLNAKTNDPGAMAEKIRQENALKKQQKEAEKEFLVAQKDEEAKQKILEEKAAEVMKQAKINKLAEQMNKFGINTSPRFSKNEMT